ncbi:MAG: protein kinase [Sodaliphilus sp.]
MTALQPGTTLQSGKYRILSTLGQGGFGITYLAENTMLEGKVAVKEFFFKEYCDRNEATRHVTIPTSGNREMVQRFKQKFVKEARTIFKLNHPNIVRILDVFEENSTAYYVMDYIEGESLSDMVKRRGSIPEAEALAYVRDAAQALNYIHSKNINHLDVKPGNLIKRRDDGKVVLIDFGVAKQYDAATSEGTTTTPVCISAGYSPMEQYLKKGVQSFSPQSDVYALAATLYKLLTGVTPPEAMAVQDEGLPVDELLQKRVSNPVRLAIAMAMKSKSERTQSIFLFLNSLAATDDEPTEPKPAPKPAPKKPAPAPIHIVQSADDADLKKSLKYWLMGGGVAVLVAVIALAIGGKGCANSSADAPSDTLAEDSVLVDTVPYVEHETITLDKGHKTKRNFVYTGEVDAEGLPHGTGKAEYPSIPTYGSAVFEGTFAHGLPSEGEIKYDTGYKFKGSYNADGSPQEGTWTEKDNYYFTGTFKNGDPYTGTWYNPDGTVYTKTKNGNTE